MSIRLKNFVSIVGLVLVAAVAAGIYQARASYHYALVDWTVMADDSFSLKPGEIRVGYEVPRAPLYGIWPNFTIKSKYPVTLGFVSADFRDLMPSDLQDRTMRVRCKVEHVRQTLLVCSELNVRKEAYVLFILDERSPGDTASNHVSVRYEVKKCLANCKSL